MTINWSFETTWSHKDGLFTAGGRHYSLGPEATTFLVTYSLIAARSRHSCLWLKATRFTKSFVPVKTGRID